MKVVIFCHSLISDWNHGNAHFLRGIVTDLIARGHTVDIYEPMDAWSVENLIVEGGESALEGFKKAYPALSSNRYKSDMLDLHNVLKSADLVLVHEWNDHPLVARIGEHHENNPNYVLLFHDTHHRSVTEPESMERYDLRGYDGVLAFGNVVRDLYIRRSWAKAAWTWHEAADVRVFFPRHTEKIGDLIWIGNWGDDERTAELHQYMIDPVRNLDLTAVVYGVRYPDTAKKALNSAGIDYRGWMPNYLVPEAFSKYRVTVHVPRRPYVDALPGIPTIRPFEALACAIPLVSTLWTDSEGLFEPGSDFLVAHDGREMEEHLSTILASPKQAAEIAAHGLKTILARHTCTHRVDELLGIYSEITREFSPEPSLVGAARS